MYHITDKCISGVVTDTDTVTDTGVNLKNNTVSVTVSVSVTTPDMHLWSNKRHTRARTRARN